MEYFENNLLQSYPILKSHHVFGIVHASAPNTMHKICELVPDNSFSISYKKTRLDIPARELFAVLLEPVNEDFQITIQYIHHEHGVNKNCIASVKFLKEDTVNTIRRFTEEIIGSNKIVDVVAISSAGWSQKGYGKVAVVCSKNRTKIYRQQMVNHDEQRIEVDDFISVANKKTISLLMTIYELSDECPSCKRPKNDHRAKCLMKLYVDVVERVKRFNNEVPCTKCGRPADKAFFRIHLCNACAETNEGKLAVLKSESFA